MPEPFEITDARADYGIDRTAPGVAPPVEEQLADAKRLSQEKRAGRSGLTRDGQPSFELVDDRTVQLTYPDKTIAKVWEKDGVVKATYENGVEVTRSEDLQVTTRPDGGEIQEFKDGTVVIKTKDGVEAEADSNGVMRLTDSDGNSISVDPDGNCVPPLADSGFTLEKTADGTVIRGKDGSAAMFTPDGRILVGKGDSQGTVLAKEFISYKPGPIPTWGKGTWRDLQESVGSPTGTKDGTYSSRN